jgi:YD repeat-containing protein
VGQRENFRKTLPVLRTVVLLLLGLASAFAQNPDPNTGFPPFGSFSNGSFDHINRANLNVNFSIPIASINGRGISLPAAMVYDSLMWKEQTAGTVQWTPVLDSANNPTWGWKIDNVLGDIKYGVTNGQTKCPDGSGNLVVTGTVNYGGYVYRDPRGTMHHFLGIHAQQGCNGLTGVYTGFASDHSGFYMDATSLGHPIVYGRDGTKIDTISGLITDVHGNYIQKQIAAGNPAETDYVDSVGRISLKVVKLASETDFQFLDIDGNYQQVRVLLGTFPIHTAFSCHVTIAEYSGTAQLPTAIMLPNATQYSFSYEPTPGVAGSYTGRVNQVTVPTGAIYQYAYTKPNDSSLCDGTDAEIQKTIKSDGNSSVWTYSRLPNPAVMIESQPDGNSSLHIFSGGALTKELQCNGSASTVQTCNGQTMRTVVPTFDSIGRPSSSTVTLEDGSTNTRQETDYDANDNMIEVREFDWYTGATPSVPTRTTHIAYSTDPTYTAKNLLSLVTRRTVYQGSATGTPISRTDITYDEPAYFDATCPSGIAHHDDSLPCSIIGRGLPTTTTSYADAVAPGGGIPQHVTYDWFGNPTKADINGVVQSQSLYSNITAFSLLDKVTSFPNAASPLVTNFTYNPYLSLPQTMTDPNGQVTTLTYDQFGRLIDTKRPDNAHVVNTFDDISRKFTSKTPIQGTDTAVSSTLYDGLGRPFRQTLTDAAGNTYSNADTQYDSMGRVKQTSNPYLGTPQYWTQTVYDALGRVTQTIPPDGTASELHWSFLFRGRHHNH